MFLPFGPSVLEPGLDLDLGQLESLGELQPLGDRQVFVRLELGLQLVQLLGAVGLSRLPVHSGLPGSPTNWLRSCQSKNKLSIFSAGLSPLTLEPEKYVWRFRVGREKTVRPLGVEEVVVLGGPSRTRGGEQQRIRHLGKRSGFTLEIF